MDNMCFTCRKSYKIGLIFGALSVLLHFDVSDDNYMEAVAPTLEEYIDALRVALVGTKAPLLLNLEEDGTIQLMVDLLKNQDFSFTENAASCLYTLEEVLKFEEEQ